MVYVHPVEHRERLLLWWVDTVVDAPEPVDGHARLADLVAHHGVIADEEHDGAGNPLGPCAPGLELLEWKIGENDYN